MLVYCHIWFAIKKAKDQIYTFESGKLCFRLFNFVFLSTKNSSMDHFQRSLILHGWRQVHDIAKSGEGGGEWGLRLLLSGFVRLLQQWYGGLDGTMRVPNSSLEGVHHCPPPVI